MAKAPTGFDISMVGDRKLQKAFEAFGKTSQGKILRPAMRAVAKDMQASAKALAPVDTGKLQKSITVRAMKRSRTRIGFVVKTGDREKLGIDPKDTGYYPFSQEFGTEFHPPQPYLRPALEAHRAGAPAKMARLMRPLMDKEVARLAAKAGKVAA